MYKRALCQQLIGRMKDSGLALFREQFHPVAAIVVGEGGIPAEEFLSISPVEWFR